MAQATKKAPKTKSGAPSPVPKEQRKITTPEQDKEIHDLVFAPVEEINFIASKLIIADTEHILNYFKQRITLEEKHLDELSAMTKKFKKSYEVNRHNLLQDAFMKYVEMSEGAKPAKLEFIEQLKQQYTELKKFKNDQQKAYIKNQKWMHSINNDYIVARTNKLPTLTESYRQKWDEIEKCSGTPTGLSPSILSPTSSIFSNHSSLTTKVDEEADNRSLSIDEDRSKHPAKHLDTSQSSRIERFMKKHLNKQDDVTKQNIKLANLKVEVAEIDTNYRNVVRELSNLAINADATNLHILKIVQLAVKEKSDKVKGLMETAIQAELKLLDNRIEPNRELLDYVQRIDTDQAAGVFNIRSTEKIKSFKKPDPVYYRNHQFGVCKDLIFGTSLEKYAQQKQRSPPLLITKCIETLEKLGGLEREGIYRVPGKQSNTEKIRHAFEIDEEAVVLGQNDVPDDVFSIASIIKIFLRELETPLFPLKLADRLNYSAIPDEELKLAYLLTKVIQLPPANYDTLKALVQHLSKLHKCVEKNKMTTSNLTLIFTPAIFQDMNHAQNSPGEWAKDSVLEDLITNYDNIFANKDIHNNTAIMGDVDYGFSHISNDQRDADRYAIAIKSPDSIVTIYNEESESGFTFTTEGEERDGNRNELEGSIHSVLDKALDNEIEKTSTGKLTPSKESSRSVSPRVSTEEKPLESTSKNHVRTNSEKKKYQSHFQEKGLKLNTGSIKSMDGRKVQKENKKTPTIRSATMPSKDWGMLDTPLPDVPKLKRSATTGRLVSIQTKKSISSKPNGKDVPDVPILKK